MEKDNMKHREITEHIIDFLVANEVSFTVPGCYDLPVGIVEDAVNEMLANGQSDLIKKHRDWMYFSWRVRELRQYGRSLGRDDFTSKEIRDGLSLKQFFDDTEDLQFLINELNRTLALEEERASYRSRRNGLSQAVRLKCLERDGYTCVSCNGKDNLEVDHIKEVIDGGGNEPENLQSLCKKCHAKKSIQARRDRKKK
jgi:5-methylcytosine-specific restriction protein A